MIQRFCTPPTKIALNQFQWGYQVFSLEIIIDPNYPEIMLCPTF